MLRSPFVRSLPKAGDAHDSGLSCVRSGGPDEGARKTYEFVLGCANVIRERPIAPPRDRLFGSIPCCGKVGCHLRRILAPEKRLLHFPSVQVVFARRLMFERTLRVHRPSLI